MLKRLVILAMLAPLLGASGVPSPFAHAFSPGESLRYKLAIDVVASNDHRSFRGNASLGVKAVGAAVSGTEVRTMSVPAQRLSRDFRINADGTLQFVGSKSDSHNYVTFDSRQYCALPSSVTVGSTWECNPPSLGLFHGGNARVRLASMSGDSATLEIDGSGTDAPRIDNDPDTGKNHTSRTSVTWHEVVRFKDGLVLSMVREQRTRTVVENLTLDSTLTAKYERL